MKAVVAAFNQEKALLGAFSVITNLRMELFQALVNTTEIRRQRMEVQIHWRQIYQLPTSPNMLELESFTSQVLSRQIRRYLHRNILSLYVARYCTHWLTKYLHSFTVYNVYIFNRGQIVFSNACRDEITESLTHKLQVSYPGNNCQNAELFIIHIYLVSAQHGNSWHFRKSHEY